MQAEAQAEVQAEVQAVATGLGEGGLKCGVEWADWDGPTQPSSPS